MQLTREGIVKGVYNGNASVMHDVAIKTVVGYLPKWDNEEYFPYDVDESERLSEAIRI